MNIIIKFSQTEKGLVFNSWRWVLLSMLIRHPSYHYFSYFFCLLCIVYACMYGYINSIVGTFQAMIQRESFIFCHYFWNSWDRGLDVFSVATKKCTGLTKAWSNFGLIFVLLVSLFTTAVDLLQVTIAFVLNIFFFVWQRESIRRCFPQALLGCSML